MPLFLAHLLLGQRKPPPPPPTAASLFFSLSLSLPAGRPTSERIKAQATLSFPPCYTVCISPFFHGGFRDHLMLLLLSSLCRALCVQDSLSNTRAVHGKAASYVACCRAKTPGPVLFVC